MSYTSQRSAHSLNIFGKLACACLSDAGKRSVQVVNPLLIFSLSGKGVSVIGYPPKGHSVNHTF